VIAAAFKIQAIRPRPSIRMADPGAIVARPLLARERMGPTRPRNRGRLAKFATHVDKGVEKTLATANMPSEIARTIPPPTTSPGPESGTTNAANPAKAAKASKSVRRSAINAPATWPESPWTRRAHSTRAASPRRRGNVITTTKHQANPASIRPIGASTAPRSCPCQRTPRTRIEAAISPPASAAERRLEGVAKDAHTALLGQFRAMMTAIPTNTATEATTEKTLMKPAGV
jgi:hypothetical protein